MQMAQAPRAPVCRSTMNRGTMTISYTPTITIYQNAGHVAAILQQQTEAGLIQGRAFGAEELATDRDRTTRETSIGGNMRGRVPTIGEAGANLSRKRSTEQEITDADKTTLTETYSYTDAYHLHLARTLLQESSQLHSMSSIKDAQDAAIGSFVEFEADFRPNELTTLLDVATPALVAAVVRFATNRSGIEAIDFDDFEKMKPQAHKLSMKVDANGELAAAITAALRADFRSETTREYYGNVSGASKLTAVTICEADSFTTADPDRMLDGTFTVLGKVVSRVERDVPTLQRNKLLSRFRPEIVDSALSELNAAMSKAPDVGEITPGEILDAAFSPRIMGASVRILPVAIYA